jgi:hypothetical protein
VASPRKPRFRQHMRVGCNVDVVLAVQGDVPLSFVPCTLVDLSEDGARCQLTGFDTTALIGSSVQLKFSLYEASHQIFAIGRVAWSTDSGLVYADTESGWAPPAVTTGPGLLGIAFLHVAERDRESLAIYCQLSGLQGVDGTGARILRGRRH